MTWTRRSRRMSDSPTARKGSLARQAPEDMRRREPLERQRSPTRSYQRGHAAPGRAVRSCPDERSERFGRGSRRDFESSTPISEVSGAVHREGIRLPMAAVERVPLNGVGQPATALLVQGEALEGMRQSGIRIVAMHKLGRQLVVSQARRIRVPGLVQQGQCLGQVLDRLPGVASLVVWR